MSALVLCRAPSARTSRLLALLRRHTSTDLVIDHGGTVPRDFHHLSARHRGDPRATAWERAFLHLHHHPPAEPVWILEDDVAASPESFHTVFHAVSAAAPDLAACDIKSRPADPAWPNWRLAANFPPRPHRSFNALCRLSPRLIRAVLDFRCAAGGFGFHEILFATIAACHGMTLLDLRTTADTRDHFQHFRFRPAIDRPVPGIAHPVKDDRLHHSICSSTTAS